MGATANKEKTTQGNNYDSRLTTKEIAAIVSNEYKKQFPNCKFSVRIETYSGGSSINVALMAADFEVVTDEARGESGIQINHYHIVNDERLTEKGKELFKTARQILNAYNFDESDSSVDYFFVNFYEHYSVGQYNKPFQMTGKKTEPVAKSRALFAKEQPASEACDLLASLTTEQLELIASRKYNLPFLAEKEIASRNQKI